MDQYKNPELSDNEHRTYDQVLYKRTKSSEDPTDDEERSVPIRKEQLGKILMVDQLWLWILDDKTSITFFSPKEHEGHDDPAIGEADLRNAIYQDVNGDYASQCSDPFDFAALIVYHAVKVLFENTTNPSLAVLRVFGEYISILTERQIQSLKDFRDDRFSRQYSVRTRIDFDGVIELKSIDNDLNTIDALIREQQAVVADMQEQYQALNGQYSKGFNGSEYLAEATRFLNGQSKTVNSMIRHAQTTERALKDLIEMKDQHDARIAQALNMKTANQSRAILIFTIFTVIFLPLSFLASIFGINAREWSGVESNLGLRDIFTYIVVISFAVVAIALLTAFNNHTRWYFLKVWRMATIPFLWPFVVRAKYRNPRSKYGV